MEQKVIMAKELEAQGRTMVQGDVVWCGLSGSGVKFQTNASEIKVELVGDSTAYETQQDVFARVSLEIDGERVAETLMDAAQKTLTVKLNEQGERIKDGMTEGMMHEVRVIKLSECAMSGVGIYRFLLNADHTIFVENTQKKPCRIEFIGDSITCGYGIDIEDVATPFKTGSEDCTKAYAFQTAKLLGADYSLFSFSGYGIISGYTDTGVINQAELLPPYYEKCGFSYAKPCLGGKTLAGFEECEWNFHTFQPDFVVINLGTNDSSFCKEDTALLEQYQKEYCHFLRVVREKNPDAKIVCCLGLMFAGENVEGTRRAVSQYIEETGDEKTFFVELPLQLPQDGLVSDYHPTKVSHEKAARVLSAYLQTLM